MWYLPRLVSPEEWNMLANVPGCTPQRSDDGEGTYAFCDPDVYFLLLESLSQAASGVWRQVA